MPLDQEKRPLHVKLVKGRWYWDPPDKLRASHKLKTQALGADQAAAWAMAHMLNRDNLRLAPDAPAVGTVRWVLELFLDSERAKSLAASTQRDYRWLTRSVLCPLKVGGRTLGELPIQAIRPRHADGIHAELAAANGVTSAHYACRFARRVWKWAARRELVYDNPWTQMELAGLKARTVVFDAGQVAAVVAAAAVRQRPSVGLATLLAYWLGHRQADVLGVTWTALDGERISTRKTGASLPVSIASYPALAAELQLTRARQQAAADAVEPKRIPPAHVVINEHTGKPYTAATFQHLWRSIAAEAGIPADLQFRDLRATAMTELSDSGADIISMSTHSGHKTAQMARRYARPTTKQFERAAGQRLQHLGEKAERPGKPQGK
jgi:site-specific recombinase XerD